MFGPKPENKEGRDIVQHFKVDQRRRDELVGILGKRKRVTAELASTQVSPLVSPQELMPVFSALEESGSIRKCRDQVGANLNPEQVAYELTP